ncbi:MAG: ATP-binding protein [Clostridiales Family XIII bacterium]|nr:ATP-binding protein [Clostridiales Family XIII bacterium]
MNDFTLHIEDFGKIESAEIELAPLTLFVGDNNSGKSYLMALIYGLFAMDRFLIKPGVFPSSTAEDLLYFDDAIADILSGNKEYVFSADDYARFERIIDSSFEHDKNAFTAHIFNKEIPIGNLRIKPHYTGTLSLALPKEPEFNRGNRIARPPNLALYSKTDGQKKQMAEWNIESLQGHFFLIYEILAAYLFGSRCNPIFLPASRTGFMLTYKSLIKHSIEKSFSPNINKTENGETILTKPCIDFLASISAISDEQYKNAPRKDLLHFIETNIMQGKISLSNMPVPDITYTPEGTDTGLSLHVSSGVVTETTPLLLELANPAVNYLLIEEPEMCLHPGLQKEMARALVKIVNSGLPVLASTHSDIILQHINNAIRLKNHPNREKIMQSLGYGDDDLISHEDVRVYQFRSQGTRSHVEKIEFDPDDGFRAKTFTDSLSAILDETMRIDPEGQ